MSVRLDQLPPEPSSLAATVAALRRELTELRAQRPDLSAADALLVPQDTDPTRWPQTTLATYTIISRSYNVRWNPTLRVLLATATSGGGAGNVRLMVEGVQWGPTVTAGSPLDYTAALPSTIAIGDQWQLSVEAQRTSGAGTVHAQIQLLRSIT